MANSVKSITQLSASTLAFVKSTVSSLDALVSKRKAWEATEFKKANEILYSLLSGCLEIFTERFLNESLDINKRELRKELISKLKSGGIKVQSNSQTITMLVRLVFGSDRKRAHGYAYVLKAAIADKISPTDLPRYISEKGGIEEIKKRMIVSEEALKNRELRLTAFNNVKANVEIAEINPLGTTDIALEGDFGEFAILIAKPNEYGMMNIVAVLRKAEKLVIDALFKRIAKENLTSQVENEAINTETNAFNFQQEQIKNNSTLQSQSLAA